MTHSISHKICRKIQRIFIRPIRVFVFHQVSDKYDPKSMYECDWTQTEDFKNKIITLINRGYIFISLVEAKKHIECDIFRRQKYAVLTADDGNKSIMQILAWLNEMNIPVTLFLNPQYMDGIHFRERPTEKYLLETDIHSLSSRLPNLSYGLHGWEHNNALKLSQENFRKSIELSLAELSSMQNYIPFYSYTWGCHNETTDVILSEYKLTPVFCNGESNYCNSKQINRECIDGNYRI